MNLSVVIPTHNRNRDVVSLVESIFRQSLDDLLIEVIIVSNLKNEWLKKWVESINTSFQVKYLEAGKIGVNTSRNLGIKHASARKIYFLDDDVILQNPLQLKNIFNLSMQNPQVAAIGGSYILLEKASRIEKEYHQICTAWLKEGESHLVGGNALYNLDILKELLHFNEDIIFGGSETELNLKIQMAGHSFLFSENLNVEHRSQVTHFSLVKKAIRQGMGRSFHEKIVPHSFWKAEREYKKNGLYDFSFHVGYRHGKKTNNGPWKNSVIFLCIIETFFQINADETLNLPNPDAELFHKQSLPGLKFRELHHWLKANTWWKIPNYLFWKVIPLAGNVVICSVGAFFPFDSQGLRSIYFRTFSKIEKIILRD